MRLAAGLEMLRKTRQERTQESIVWVEHGATSARLDTVAVNGAKYAGVLVDRSTGTTLQAVRVTDSKVGLLVRNALDVTHVIASAV